MGLSLVGDPLSRTSRCQAARATSAIMRRMLATVVPIIIAGLAIVVVAASWTATRGDKRYEIASSERDEYRARAERLAEDLRLLREETSAPRVEHVLAAVEDLHESILVHSDDPSFPDRRRGQAADAPRRRLTDA